MMLKTEGPSCIHRGGGGHGCIAWEALSSTEAETQAATVQGSRPRLKVLSQIKEAEVAGGSQDKSFGVWGPSVDLDTEVCDKLTHTHLLPLPILPFSWCWLSQGTIREFGTLSVPCLPSIAEWNLTWFWNSCLLHEKGWIDLFIYKDPYLRSNIFREENRIFLSIAIIYYTSIYLLLWQWLPETTTKTRAYSLYRTRSELQPIS